MLPCLLTVISASPFLRGLPSFSVIFIGLAPSEATGLIRHRTHGATPSLGFRPSDRAHKVSRDVGRLDDLALAVGGDLLQVIDAKGRVVDHLKRHLDRVGVARGSLAVELHLAESL